MTISPARLLPAALALALALGLAALAGPAAPSALGAPGASQAARERAATQALGTTTFRLASINLLGAGHTDGPRPKRRGFAKSPARLRLTLAIMNREAITVAGFQEMHPPQAVQWKRDMGARWGLYPGPSKVRMASQNSVTWRKDLYTAVRRHTVLIPYFGGRDVPMPYVLLRNRQTGQHFWLLNVHNPANSAGPAQRHRDEAVRRQAALIKQLRQESPRIPVFMTGDMNDRDKFFCPMVSATGIAAANGGFARGAECTPPQKMRVDWVMGTTDNTFTGYRDLQDASVKRASDHPFIIADANIPSARMAASPINRVVTIAVAGLRGPVIPRLGAARLPNLTRLLATGAGTLEARTAPESSRSLPNLVSMLTGQRVDRTVGHGVTTDGDPGGTTHSLSGRYVPTVLGLAHNLGRRTTFVSSAPRSSLVLRSYDQANGGGDPYGRDNGDAKIDTGALYSTDTQTIRALNTQLAAAPSTLSVAELTAPEQAGMQHGFGTARYSDALRAVDQLIGTTMRAIRRSPTLNGHTLLVVTGISGGIGKSNADRSLPSNYRVPILVSGPGVQAGGDLYAMNPGWRSPRANRVGYGNGPIFTGDVANLITGALRLPPLPGSYLNRGQRLSPWQP